MSNCVESCRMNIFEHLEIFRKVLATIEAYLFKIELSVVICGHC